MYRIKNTYIRNTLDTEVRSNPEMQIYAQISETAGDEGKLQINMKTV